MNRPKPLEKYRHFKGKLYQIITLAEHSESGEELVIYQALYGEYKIFARPLSMFLEETDRSKYPEATQKYRFERVSMEKAEPEKVQNKKHAAEQKQAANPQQRQSQHAEEPHTTEGSHNIEKLRTTEGAHIIEGSHNAEEPHNTAGEGELTLDPLVIAFLDADSYGEKLNILTGLHHRITDDMINVMAMASDLEIRENDVEERYIELKNCLLKMEKFECNRLR